ncbi:hypothetical protein MKZ08_06690 [Viridibacillus sp. FSL R5-0477]|uniref:Uncharacterized protein n=1 Tax=Viridibacillus arenosi FSL R5-213 TaxID=1227360 RepID=W4ENT1_9BACL|nr:hypothetical protein [Viridibacillus arenosi]ETT82253.1 hypothetical protein C176_14722 [Viridibacillus arenosi FSL R5-213]OMC92642.1 hypothetical protein BK137_06275 [Viridibacillus arenosi]
MAVFEVIYRGTNGNELITLDSIEDRVDFEEVKYDIYCSTTGCDCRMEYVPRGIKVAYFKKWRGNDYQHSLDCTHYTDTETGNRPRKRLGIHSSRLRSDHKKSILNDMYKKYIENEEEREARKERERKNRRNRTNKRVETGREPVEEIVNRPTTDNQGEVLLEGDRNPPVPRSYSIIHISRDQLDSTLALMDIIIEVENDFNNPDEKRTVITLTNQNMNMTFKIILDPVFFAQSPLNIDRMLEGLKQRAVHGETMILGAVGQIIERDNELCMSVFGEDGIRVNGKPIFVYFSNAS